jgi:hypothetical protein
MKLQGKALIAKKRTEAGKDVIMLCGCFSTDSKELKNILGDEFNLAIMKMTIDESAIHPEDEQITGSPEDFLEHMETMDWKKVVKDGTRTMNLDFS